MDVAAAKAKMVEEMNSDKPDRARLATLQRDTFRAQREWLKNMGDTQVKCILDEYPILKDPYFIEKEFLLLYPGKPLKFLQQNMDKMVSVMEQVLGKVKTTEGQDSVFKVMELVSKTVAARGKYSKINKGLITMMESHDVDMEKLSDNDKAEPPPPPLPEPGSSRQWQWYLVHHCRHHQCVMQ